MTVALAGALRAEPRDEVRAYFFGNSLIHHLTDGGRTNVPVWLNALAKADGRNFAVNGQWGFLRNFADEPTIDNWSFRGVPRAWNPDRGGFAIGRFDSVITNPANFVQYQPANAPYDGDNPNNHSPLSATVKLWERVIADAPQTRLFIYEGWADLAGITETFPPQPDALARYHAENTGRYHDWYIDYVAQINAALPDHKTVLIPVGSVLSTLLTEPPLAGLDPTILYLDDAPHGTETLYFLAAMISYAVLYDAPLPKDYTDFDAIDATVAGAYAQLADRIWTLTAAARAEAGAATPAPVTAAPSPVAPTVEDPQPLAATPEPESKTEPAPEPVAATPAPTPEPASTDTEPDAADPAPTLEGLPALAMGLNGINDWTTQHPFLDAMKTSRPWIGHTAETWGALSTDQLRADGYLDEYGWPLRLPENATALESFILTDQPTEAEHLRGWYVLSYEGQGQLKVGGRAKRVGYEPGRARFFFEPGDGPVAIRLEAIEPGDPIRNISVVPEKYQDLFEAGAIFNPDWTALIGDMRTIRFMDWMRTNGSTIASWDDRPRETDATYAAWGVPLPVMLRLANHLGADPWFTLPHMADDDYVRRFAEAVRDGLDPQLKAYVEYSNEVWNFAFPQAGYARDRSIELWGESETGWMQFYGKRAAEIADIWTKVFGDAAERRLVRVVATHTGWPGLEENILQAPLVLLEKGKAPVESFDAYAVTGYFGLEMGQGDVAAEVRDLIARSTARADKDGQDKGLRRVALREYVKENRFDAAFGPMEEAVRAGSMAELISDVWPHHARVARRAGLDLIMYEGGTHIVGHGETVQDEDLSAFFNAFNYSPQMTAIYADLLQAWSDVGGVLFNAFVDVAPASQWGSWGHLRHLDDRTGRWDVLMAFNATGPNSWESRTPSDFAGGIVRVGGDGADTLTGQRGDDVLSGRGGDDTFRLLSGYDVVHGGPGADLAEMPLSRSEYAVRRDGDALLLEADGHQARLTSVETLRFAGSEDTVAESNL